MENKAQTIIIDDVGIKKLLELLNNSKSEQAQNMESLVSSIHSIENTLLATMEEIQSIKKHYNIDQQATTSTPSAQTKVQEVVKNEIISLEKNVHTLTDNLNSIKNSLVDKVREILSATKKIGINGLNKTSELVHLKDGLIMLNKGVNNTIKGLEKSIENINSATQELNASAKHFKNVGKAIIGKERNTEYAQANEKITQPLNSIKKRFETLEKTTKNALTKVDSLSQSAKQTEKTSDEKTEQDKDYSILKASEDELDAIKEKGFDVEVRRNPQTDELLIKCNAEDKAEIENLSNHNNKITL